MTERGLVRSIHPMFSALPLPAGDLGVWWTVNVFMRSMVNREMFRPEVRLTAVGLVERVPSNDPLGRAEMIREYLVDHVRFVPDPTGTEALHGPVWQIQQIWANGRVNEDCDDVAMLAAALGKSVGLVARFVVVGFGSPTAPFRHIWTELGTSLQGPWVECDITREAQDLPPVPSRIRVVSV